jgi:hypothetical protein
MDIPLDVFVVFFGIIAFSLSLCVSSFLFFTLSFFSLSFFFFFFYGLGISPEEEVFSEVFFTPPYFFYEEFYTSMIILRHTYFIYFLFFKGHQSETIMQQENCVSLLQTSYFHYPSLS